MKRAYAFVFLILLASTQLSAQQVDDTLRYAESVWSMEKKAMILEELNLTEAEKSAFWPVYESYASAIQYLDMEYIRLLQLSEKAHSGKKSASVTEHMLMNDLLLAKTRRQYFRKFRKALSPAQASRFMHLDNDFRTMLRIQMQKQSPALITSLDRIYSRN